MTVQTRTRFELLREQFGCEMVKDIDMLDKGSSQASTVQTFRLAIPRFAMRAGLVGMTILLAGCGRNPVERPGSPPEPPPLELRRGEPASRGTVGAREA